MRQWGVWRQRRGGWERGELVGAGVDDLQDVGR